MIKHDICSERDVEILVNNFYGQIKQDTVIGFIFNEIARVDWGHHIPKICAFWNTVLFGHVSYKGNPLRTHLELNHKIKLTQEHFDHWVTLWCNTVDSFFIGEKAEEAKQRAKAMRKIMLLKIADSANSNFIM